MSALKDAFNINIEPFAGQCWNQPAWLLALARKRWSRTSSTASLSWWKTSLRLETP